MNLDFSLNQIFLESIDYLFQFNVASKRLKPKTYYLRKGIIDNYNIINGKNFYDQAINSDIKRYEEIRKLRLYYWMFIRL